MFIKKKRNIIVIIDLMLLINKMIIEKNMW